MWLLLLPVLLVMDSRVLMVSLAVPAELRFQQKEAESTSSQKPKETSPFPKHPSQILVRRKNYSFLFELSFMPGEEQAAQRADWVHGKFAGSPATLTPSGSCRYDSSLGN